MTPPACPFCARLMRVEFRLTRQGWRCDCGYSVHDAAEAKDVTNAKVAAAAKVINR